MTNPWIAVAALGVVAIGLPLVMMVASWVLRPRIEAMDKRTIYESAEVPTGHTRIRFNIQYYMVALLFVVFDIETVLIFPWTVIYRDAIALEGVGLMRALVPMLAFIGILVVALAWAWRNDAVKWTRSPAITRRARHE